MEGEYTYLYAATIIATLFIIPFAIIGRKQKLHDNFKFQNFISVLNKSALAYGIMGLMAVIFMAVSAELVETSWWYRNLSEGGGYIILMALYIFAIILLVFFFRALLILHLLRYFFRKRISPAK